MDEYDQDQFIASLSGVLCACVYLCMLRRVCLCVYLCKFVRVCMCVCVRGGSGVCVRESVCVCRECMCIY